MNKKTASFQQTMRRSFIVYAIVPTFILAILGLSIFLGGWAYSIVHYNQMDNQKIVELLGAEADRYLQEITAIQNFFEAEGKDEPLKIDQETEAQLYELLYELGWQGNEGNQVVLFNEQGKFRWSAREREMGLVKKPEYLAFGVLRQMQEQPEQICVGLQENYWCFGKGLYQEQKLIGYVVIGLSDSAVSRLLKEVERQYVLTDPYGFVYTGNGETLLDNLGRLVLRKENGFLSYEEENYYLTMQKLPVGELYVTTITNTIPVARIGLWMIVSVLMIFLLIGIITYFTTKKASEKYTKDVNAIASAFVKVENGQWDVTLNSNSTTEFQTIGKAFNKMTDSMKRQMEENKELATYAAFAQVQQLESQFNPHFLFNTLDNIRFMTRIDVAAADKMILALSKLLRYSIQDSGEEIAVREDVENLQSYFHILQIRFNKRFSYQIEIDEEVQDCLIPKLIIQPLIENSVKYGFKNKEKLNVKIRGYRKNDQLIFSCEDDGAGISKSQLCEIQERLTQRENRAGHLGIYNIHRRIQLMYGMEYGIFIESHEGEGVQVVLIIPYHKKQERIEEERG